MKNYRCTATHWLISTQPATISTGASTPTRRLSDPSSLPLLGFAPRLTSVYVEKPTPASAVLTASPPAPPSVSRTCARIDHHQQTAPPRYHAPSSTALAEPYEPYPSSSASASGLGMNWSKKNRFVRDVARGAVGTKADAMAANTSSFAIIFALCVMAVGWQWIGLIRNGAELADFYPQQHK